MSIRRHIGQELALHLSRSIEREHTLRQLFWECTLRCNMHCRHCGSDCKRVAGVVDMPAEDFLRVLDSVARKCDPHNVFVIITGGEPLIRDDLEETCRRIYDRGFPWGLVTNGLYLTPERFQRLRKAGMHTVALSLDGMEANHNWMRGHKDAFQMASQAIDLLVASPLRFDCVTCVNRRNYTELPAIRDFLIHKGVQEWRIYTVFPMGRAKDDPDMRLSGEEFRGVFEFIKQTRHEGRIKASYGCEGYLGEYEGEVRDHFFRCQAGISVGSVMADGAIAACASIRADYNQGNIYQDDFMEVWEHRYQPHRTFEWRRTGDCANCRHWRYCRGNGMHLRDDEGRTILCHMKRLKETEQSQETESSITHHITSIMKAITKVTTLLLSSLLALLGFGGCRSAKKAQREMEAEQHRMDSIARADLERQEQEEALRQRQKEIERQRARENEIRVLYGPPPSRFIKNIDK